MEELQKLKKLLRSFTSAGEVYLGKPFENNEARYLVNSRSEKTVTIGNVEPCGKVDALVCDNYCFTCQSKPSRKLQ